MKLNRVYSLIIMLFTLLPLWSQSDIYFSLKKVEPSSQIPEEVAEALNNRIRQVLNRNSAAAADIYNVFAVEPVLSITDIKKTSGMVQNVTLAKGELTLIALNTADQAEYYSKTVELSVEVTGGDKTNAMLKLVNSIKITDAQYTRFIRTARNKIAEYYTSHCDQIIKKGENLAAVGKYCEAINYLSAVPQVAPCWENANELIQEYAEGCKAEAPVVEPADEAEGEEPQEEPEPTPASEPVVEPVVEPIVETTPEPQTQNEPQIIISTKDYDFKILSCVGELSRKMIVITARIENLTTENHSPYSRFDQAFTDNGKQLTNLEFDGGYYPSFPARVWVKKSFIVKGVFDKFDSFSYLKINMGNTVIEIRDLKIDWQ